MNQLSLFDLFDDIACKNEESKSKMIATEQTSIKPVIEDFSANSSLSAVETFLKPYEGHILTADIDSFSENLKRAIMEDCYCNDMQLIEYVFTKDDAMSIQGVFQRDDNYMRFEVGSEYISLKSPLKLLNLDYSGPVILQKYDVETEELQNNKSYVSMDGLVITARRLIDK